MTIIVNGNAQELKPEMTMQQLIETLQLEGKVMAAAVNMNIVKQEGWNDHQLHDGDKVELLDFVGGG